MAINSFDKDRLPVHKQLGVLDLNSPESEIDRGALHQSSLREGVDFQSVKIRSLSAPESWGRYGAVGNSLKLLGSRFSRSDTFAILVKDLVFQFGYALGHLRLDREVPVHPGGDIDILNTLFLTGIGIHSPGDSREAPEVLVLEVSAVAPAENLQCDLVLAPDHEPGDIETSLKFAVLAVADHLTVDPDTDIGCGRAYAEADLLANPRRINLEGTTVLTHIVALCGRVRRIILVMTSPGISHIDIQRISESVELPHPGNRHGLPGRIIVPDGLEPFCAAFYGLVPVELPYSIQ